MKTLLAVAILTLTLTVSASAGQIQTPGVVPSGGGTPVSTSVILAIVNLICS